MITSASAIENVAVFLVDYVDDYGKFIPSNATYQLGDTVKVYSQAEKINHNRAYAVDFVFVIYDPEDYPVAGTVISKKGADWTDRVYAVYQFRIPDGWKTGEYRIELYVFDVLNSSATYEDYRSFFDELIKSGDAKIDVLRLPRSEVDYKKKDTKFYVVDDVRPEIYLFDSGLKASVLPEGMNNTLQVSVFNAGNEKADFYLSLLIDGEFFSKERVVLEPYSSTRIEFSVPQLEVGDHKLELIPDWVNYRKVSTLPVYVKPYLFKKPLLMGSFGKGILILSPNNYVLGSGGVSGLDEKDPKFDFERKYDMNRDNAAKILTNIIAYFWKNGNNSKPMRIGLYYMSDPRADETLGNLIEYIKNLNQAPVEYAGAISDYELNSVDILVYVTNNPELERLQEYLKNGGKLVIDINDYYFDTGPIAEGYSMRNATELEKTFYDLTTIDKTVSIRIKTELKLPPELKYSNLSVSDFIVEVGNPVKISFDVKNEGGAGIADVFVRINDVIVYNQTLKIFQGEKRQVEFEYVPEKEGSYKVVLDDTSISKVFFARNVTEEKNVTETPVPSVEEPEKRDPTLITALAGVLAILIILRMYLRR